MAIVVPRGILIDMRVFRIIFAKLYKVVIKPLLFKLSPDDAHTYLVKVAKVWQQIPVVRPLTRLLLAPKNSERLKQEFFGVSFLNPVGISAGFDKNIELQPTLDMIGCGFETGGSVTFPARKGNERPWFYRLPKTKSLVVHAGLANAGIEKIALNIKKSSRVQERMPLIVSVAVVAADETCTIKQAIDDACKTMQYVQDNKLSQVIEVNISCPNAQDGQPFSRIKNLKSLLNTIDGLKLTLPVLVKMPNMNDWRDFEPLLDEIVGHNIKGVTISNLVKDRESVSLKDDLPDDVLGGLSGAPTKDRSNQLIRRTYKKYGHKLIIIGVGGIFSATDAYEKIKNGASMVALITGMIFEGPQLIGDINHDLVSLLEADGYMHISEAVGRSVNKRA